MPAESDFDALSAAARAANTQPTMDILWRAVYALDRWHFVARGEMPRMRPFVGVVDHRPFVMAFTDPKRAHAFAILNKLQLGDGLYPTMSMSVPSAVNVIKGLTGQGIFGVMFNRGPNGFYAPIANLPAMLEHFKLPPAN